MRKLRFQLRKNVKEADKNSASQLFINPKTREMLVKVHVYHLLGNIAQLNNLFCEKSQRITSRKQQQSSCKNKQIIIIWVKYWAKMLVPQNFCF